MQRDVTMIVSVLISIVSLIFGVYKNIEAGNAKAYAFRQAYQILGVVDRSAIGSSAKAQILDGALGVFGTPPPVLDLSSSSASTPAAVSPCAQEVQSACLAAAARIATLNATCVSGKDAGVSCDAVSALKQKVQSLACGTCFNY